MLGCIHGTLSWLSTRHDPKKLSFKLEIYSDRAICFGSLGRLQDIHAMLSPFFQPFYSAVLNEKSNSLLPTYTLLEE